MRQRPTTPYRKLAMRGFEVAEGGHTFYALLELDVTGLRGALRERRAAGSGGSLFSFFLKAIAKSLEEHPELNSMTDARKRTVFDAVDIDIPVEIFKGGENLTKQHIIRDVNAKTLRQVDEEIAEARKNLDDAQGFLSSKAAAAALCALPAPLVRLIFRLAMLDHERVRRMSGTVFVTSVSMFSDAPGYVIPYAGGPKAVSFALGSSVKKPVVVGDQVVVREMMNVTAAFNHDCVDGAPAARFINTLRAYVEKRREALF